MLLENPKAPAAKGENIMTTLQINKLTKEPTIDIKESVIDFIYPMMEKALGDWQNGGKALINIDDTFNALHGYTFNQQNRVTTKLYNQHFGFEHKGFISQSSFNKLYKEHGIKLIKGTKLCPIWFNSIVFTKAAKDLLVKYGYKRSSYPSQVSKEVKAKIEEQLNAAGEKMIYRFSKLSYVANVESFENLLGTENEKLLKENKNITAEQWQLIQEQEKNSTELKDLEFINSMIVNMESKPNIKFHREMTAYYRPSTDTVNVRRSSDMLSDENFLETVIHELIHSTNHQTRTNRRNKVIYNETHGRSLEECVAEIGMLYSLKRFDDNAIDKDKIYNNAGLYIKGWLSMFKTKKEKVERLLIAAKLADQAEKYIFQPKEIKIVNKPIDKQFKGCL